MKLKQISWITTIGVLSLFGTKGYSNSPCHTHGQNLAEEIEICQLSPMEGDLEYIEGNIFRINLNSLGKDHEFLFYGNMASAKESDFSSNQAQLIWFKLESDKILVYRSNSGQVVDPGQKHALLIASTPVLSVEEDSVLFDMTSLLSQYNHLDWYHAPQISKKDNSLNFAHSEVSRNIQLEECVVQKVIKSANNSTLSIQADAVTPYSDGLINDLKEGLFPVPKSQSSASVSVTYFLARVDSNSTFIPRRGSLFEKVGYFEAYPQIEPKTGAEFRNIQKWDVSDPLNKPITFYLSHNTPEKYRPALFAAIQFVAKHFQEGLIDAQMAPEGIQAPHPDFNIIQWTDHAGKGLAYADVMAHPLTGEIHHAQVNLYSGYMERTRQKLLDKYSREFDLIHQDKIDTLLGYVLACVLSHELVHVMGVRHNFAGHKANQMTPKNFDAAFEQLLADPAAQIQIPTLTSSIMDYLSLEGDVLLGSQIVQGKLEPLEHDRLTIEWGYSDQPINEKEMDTPLFSTDDHAMPNDIYATFANPFVEGNYSIIKRMRDIPNDLFLKFIAAKSAADVNKRCKLDQVELNSRGLAKYVLKPLTQMLRYLKGNLHLREVEYPEKSSTLKSSKDRQRRYFNWVEEKILEAGGFCQVVLGTLRCSINGDQGEDTSEPKPKNQKINPKNEADFPTVVPKSGWIAKLKKQYLDQVENAHQKTFIGYDGEPIFFTAEELNTMKSLGEAFFDDFAGYMVLLSLKSLNKIDWNISIPSPISHFWEKGYSDLIDEGNHLASCILKDEHQTKFVTGKIKKSENHCVHLTFPEFTYPQKTRIQAAKWMGKIINQLYGTEETSKEVSDWMSQQFSNITRTEVSMANFSLEHEINLEFKKWLQQQLEVKQNLG